MNKITDLPDTIAVFPLPGALLLPRGRLPLHIFEPRYLAMIEDCLKTKHRLIGMIQSRDVPGTGEKRLNAIGCAGRVTGFSETEDGRYMISLSGISRFRVKEEVQGFTPYRRCLVDWAPFGRDLGATLTEAEVRWLMTREFARGAADVVWRRTKLGLRMTADQIAKLDAFMIAAAKDGALGPAAE